MGIVEADFWGRVAAASGRSEICLVLLGAELHQKSHGGGRVFVPRYGDYRKLAFSALPLLVAHSGKGKKTRAGEVCPDGVQTRGWDGASSS